MKYKYIPLFVGLFLGIISIIMGQIPRNIAQFTGMTMIGNEIGYLWGALIVAWVCYENWRNSFIASTIAMTTATFTYYSVLIVLYHFEPIRFAMRINEPVASQMMGFVMWTIIGVIISLLAATAVWMAKCAKSKLLNYGIFAIAYIGMLGVIFYFRALFAIRWYKMTIERDGVIHSWDFFIGMLYEIGFAFVVTTILVGIGLGIIIKKNRNPKNSKEQTVK
ncbi:MAG: hypothetical protein FWB71_05615 [Defluviitaleaceae bacterium]|nr:hypothetical protein [Defluviitaleaceae bacterium]